MLLLLAPHIHARMLSADWTQGGIVRRHEARRGLWDLDLERVGGLI